jgi:hypothetical protein
MVSGGDALLEIRGMDNASWSAQIDGRDVTKEFRPTSNSSSLLALLKGLKVGKNLLEIRVNGVIQSTLELVNHPLSGPILSGPHEGLFICETATNGLGQPLDADCNAKPLIQYYYKSTKPAEGANVMAWPAPSSGNLAIGFKPLDPTSPPPDDVALISTPTGETVPYIVRREIGTINRAVYEIQFLHRPGRPLPTPWGRERLSWNGRIVDLVGGGGNLHHQGTLGGSIGEANEPFLVQGYATITSTLDLMTNIEVTAETLSMLKEHFIKEYGEPVHTIGWGGSARAILQYLVAQNYPGLLDGLIPSLAYSDVVTSLAYTNIDCRLLDHAFERTSQHWTEDQKTAVAGFATWRLCSALVKYYEGWLTDPKKCDPLIPKDKIYDRVSNPNGIRCDFYDDEINVLGRNALSGGARRAWDNVGVQYGLAAFLNGAIDAEHFVELNESVGGNDDEGHIVAMRTAADAEAVHMAYAGGLVMTGGGGINQVPIIEWRPYGDDMMDGHDYLRSFVTRARLLAANGSADNQVMITYPRYTTVDWVRMALGYQDVFGLSERAHELLPKMDRWLDNIAADQSPNVAEKVRRDRPPDVADGCWTINARHIAEPMTYGGGGECNRLYPPHANPRIVAGSPLADDVLKCQLKPVSAGDYTHALNADQLNRLQVVFPTGVCDYSKPGVGQEITRKTWQRY